jgi:alkylation response protein AidB-like acyl-CoA dehydrogenase
MDFSLTEEQETLAGMARSLSSDLFGDAVARQALGGDRSGADKGWAHLQETGLASLLVPERLGGGGGGVLDACVVLTELSAALAPVPYLTSAVAVPSVLLAIGGEEAEKRLRALAAGETVSLVVDENLRWPGAAGRGTVCLDAAPGRSALAVVGGTPRLCTDVTTGTGIDPLHPIGTIAAVGGGSGDAVAGSLAGRRALAAMRVGSAAALTGCLAGAAQLAWDYVTTREQYGRPLASFQVVRHLAADLLVDLETCRSVSYGAAWMVDNDDVAAAERAAAIAKAWCGQAAVRSVETATQLLGGIGVTWESTAHLHLRNAHLLSASFGDTRSLLRELGTEFIAERGGPRGLA